MCGRGGVEGTGKSRIEMVRWPSEKGAEVVQERMSV